MQVCRYKGVSPYQGETRYRKDRGFYGLLNTTINIDIKYYGMDVPTLSLYLRAILTVTSVYTGETGTSVYTGETGDINTAIYCYVSLSR